jgi:TRAP-type C4-dicarboxylate transport system substrate-binding protein
MGKLKLVTFILVGLMLVTTSLVGACAKPEPTTAPVEVIELTFASPFIPTVPFGLAAQGWIDKIERETNGRVHITPYWGGTLIDPKEGFKQLSAGVCDIAFCYFGYSPGGFDLARNYMAFNYLVSDMEVRRRIYKEVCAKFPEIEAEYANWKIMEVSGGQTMQLVCNKPVRKVDDLRGLTLRTPLADLTHVLKALGAEAASNPPSEIYTCLEKGILDGTIGAIEQVKSFRLAEVAKYITLLNYGSSAVPHHFMNWDSFNSLPPDIQKVFEDSIEWWGLEVDKSFLIQDQEALAFAKELGVEIIELSPEELNKFFKVEATVVSELAAELDAKGIRGTKILQEILRLAEKYSK